MQRTTIYIIIPVYNEAETIRQVIISLLPLQYQVVVVDDASSDNSFAQFCDLPLHYIRHEVNLGQGAALQTGIDYALQQGAEYFITFDGDGQHSANDIERLMQPLIAGDADFVLGSRFLPSSTTNVSFIRKNALFAARCLNYLFTGLWLSDAHNGLRAFNARAARFLNLKENGMAHASEILFRIREHDLIFIEVPVNIYYSDYSHSKGQSLFNSVKIFFDIVLNRIFH